MGISAAELLKTLCSLFISASPESSGRSERGLVRRAHTGARTLSKRPDEELGSIFLDRFSSLRTFFNASQKDVTFKTVRQAYAKDFIEKKLRIKLPEVISNALQARTPRQGFDIIATAFLPTLAPSLHSSDMVALRTLSDQIKHTMGVKEKVSMTLPSSALPDPSRSNTTLPSMSEISERFANTLSFSSFQQASSTVLSNVRDRVVAIEGGFGEAIQRRIP
jgi:hypothetical protein